jgi:hypothetical protein
MRSVSRALHEDQGYHLPFLLWPARRQPCEEDIWLTNLDSFVWFSIEFAWNIEMSFKALTTARQNVERLCKVPALPSDDAVR